MAIKRRKPSSFDVDFRKCFEIDESETVQFLLRRNPDNSVQILKTYIIEEKEG